MSSQKKLKIKDVKKDYWLPQTICRISKELAENKAQSAKIALITLGRNAGEEADRNIDEDFNLANDELNLIETVAAFTLKVRRLLLF
jgi:beta-glucosidase